MQQECTITILASQPMQRIFLYFYRREREFFFFFLPSSFSTRHKNLSRMEQSTTINIFNIRDIYLFSIVSSLLNFTKVEVQRLSTKFRANVSRNVETSRTKLIIPHNEGRITSTVSAALYQ